MWVEKSGVWVVEWMGVSMGRGEWKDEKVGRFMYLTIEKTAAQQTNVYVSISCAGDHEVRDMTDYWMDREETARSIGTGAVGCRGGEDGVTSTASLSSIVATFSRHDYSRYGHDHGSCMRIKCGLAF